MGDKIGRIHMKSQTLSELQTRKMKGLKRKASESDGEDKKKKAKKPIADV
jgi:hypothetical protein